MTFFLIISLFQTQCLPIKGSLVLIDLDKYDSDDKFIKERSFEVILTSFSTSNYYRNVLKMISCKG